MRKKIVKTKPTPKKSAQSLTLISIRYLIVPVLALIIGGGMYLGTDHITHTTLGATTYLARDGGDSTGGSSGSSNQESETTLSSDNSGSSNLQITPTNTPKGTTSQIDKESNTQEKLEVESSDGTDHIDLKSPDVRVHFEQKNDQTVVTAKQEDGTEVELGDDATQKVENELEKHDLHIDDEHDHFLIRSASTTATTKFPLSLDLATNSLMVTTPQGTKTVTVLPDQAVQNLLSHKILSRITVIPDTSASSAAQPQMELTTENNQLVFTVQGESDQKFLGIIPVKINKTVHISAETGTVVKTDMSFLERILDSLSIS